MCNNNLRKFCVVVASLFVSLLVLAQEGRTITGTVVDANQTPLVGAGVVVEGQPTIGTVTDLDRHYTLQVPADAQVLRFSFDGCVAVMRGGNVALP